jgi:CheY-like chemotaxis protein
MLGDGSGQGRTVLVIDDEPSVLGLVAAVLEVDGYAVLQAADAREALLLAGEGATQIDVVIADVGVVRPGLAEGLRALQPGARLLYASGSGDAAGACTPFLGKPFTARALLDTVRRLEVGAT